MIVDFEACAAILAKFEETKRKNEDWKRVVMMAAEQLGMGYREICVTRVVVDGFYIRCEDDKFYWDGKKLNKLSEVIALMTQRAIKG